MIKGKSSVSSSKKPFQNRPFVGLRLFGKKLKNHSSKGFKKADTPVPDTRLSISKILEISGRFIKFDH